MSAKDWRVLEMCENCPFRKNGQAIFLRKGRLAEIKRELRRGADFPCHKTAHGEETEEGDYIPTGKERLCAGAIAYQDSVGVCSDYRQVAERLDWFAEQRAQGERQPADT